jgi:hypothetical protein
MVQMGLVLLARNRVLLTFVVVHLLRYQATTKGQWDTINSAENKASIYKLRLGAATSRNERSSRIASAKVKVCQCHSRLNKAECVIH